MRGQEVKHAWYASLYTGLFWESGFVPLRPHDPGVPIWSGIIADVGRIGNPPGPDGRIANPSYLTSGGAGWTQEAAEAAGVGEAVERWQAWPLACDWAVTSSFAAWSLDEPAVEPERWVLFHPEQYALPGFPFAPLDRRTVCRWVCFRQAGSGLPWWAPEELAYLSVRPGGRNLLGPSTSTGLSCGRVSDPVLLRGLQEVIERDALLGAWWDRYPLEEHDAARVFATLPPSIPPCLLRPNLRYRCYRIVTPLGAHVTMATVAGEDREGYCFAAGSACRETRTESWLKSLLEAVQGRHYVRYLKGQLNEGGNGVEVPQSFAEHAVYYSLHPGQVAGTVLARATAPKQDEDAGRTEGFAELEERLGPSRPVLFRHLTPPGLAAEQLGWCVLRVLVPGLQPLHGHHGLPFLGGPLWLPRGLQEWASMPPHTFA
jgi:ribosomal protein S12 methylthiotransferase accessory factor